MRGMGIVKRTSQLATQASAPLFILSGEEGNFKVLTNTSR